MTKLTTTRTIHRNLNWKVLDLVFHCGRTESPRNLQRPIFFLSPTPLIQPQDLDFLRRWDEEHFECIMWAAAKPASINSDTSFSSLTTRASQCFEGWIIQKFSRQDCCSLPREQLAFDNNVKSFPTQKILSKFTYSWKHFPDCLGWQFLGGRGFADFWELFCELLLPVLSSHISLTWGFCNFS